MINIDFEFVAIWLLVFSILFMSLNSFMLKKQRQRCFLIASLIAIECMLCIVTNLPCFSNGIAAGREGLVRLKTFLIMVYANMVFVSLQLLFDYCRYELERNMSKMRWTYVMMAGFILVLDIGQFTGKMPFYDISDGGFVRYFSAMILLSVYMSVYFLIILFMLVRKYILLGKKRSVMIGTLLVLHLLMLVAQIQLPEILLLDVFQAIVFAVYFIFLQYVDDTKDMMTGALTEKGFMREASYFLHRTHTDEDYSIVSVSIHDFKNINHRFGRSAGDQTLAAIADNIIRKLGNEGLCARISADNFIVLLPSSGISDIPADKINLGKVLKNSRFSDYAFTFYYGIYQISDRNMPVSYMMENAVYAMNLIRDNYLMHCMNFTAQMESRISVEREMENMMFMGMEEHEFVVFYQPVFDLDTGELASAEALVRWNNKKYGMIAPGEFIPLFEKNGFVSILDKYVMEQVCIQLKRWKESGKRCIPVSVNVSRQELKNAEFCTQVENMVEEYGLDPSDLKLEITESAFAEDEHLMMLLMEELHEKGFKIMMDDFGSGYSSFNTFGTIPVDILKIDMRFMESIEESERSKAVFESIINMTKRMKMPVVVEGVETEAQVDFVKDLSCEQVQGFYFSKPLELSRFEKLLSMQG